MKKTKAQCGRLGGRAGTGKAKKRGNRAYYVKLGKLGAKRNAIKAEIEIKALTEVWRLKFGQSYEQ